MGFLNHATTNVIVDAVLTNDGRTALSKNDGSFSIFGFSLADDEVDYTIIKQFGRTVGIEKIEKNTPCLEAPTLSNVGLKYKLVSSANPNLTYLPIMNVTSPSITSPITLSTSTAANAVSSKDIYFEIDMDATAAISFPQDFADPAVEVKVDDNFLRIQNPAISPSYYTLDNYACYTLTNLQNTSTGGKQGKFSIGLKTFNTNTFNLYSTSTSSSKFVSTFVHIKGIASGLTLTFEVRIEQ